MLLYSLLGTSNNILVVFLFYPCIDIWQFGKHIAEQKTMICLKKIGNTWDKIIFRKNLKEVQWCKFSRVALKLFGFRDCTVVSNPHWS